MMNIVYETATGRPLAAHLGQDLQVTRAYQCIAGQSVIEAPLAAPSDIKYGHVVDGQLQPRPTQSTQLTGLTLTALPANATLHIDDQAYPLDDTTVALDFPLPGTYRLRVTCWPYLDWTGEVTV